MGKKRIATKKGQSVNSGLVARSLSRAPKKKIDAGTLFIHASYNNTKAQLADKAGAVALWATSGALGFKGARKGTPYAAAKVGELLGDKAQQMGVKEVNVIIKGVGSGRESLLRAFANKGVQVSTITDATPMPHNGPRMPKPRRV